MSPVGQSSNAQLHGAQALPAAHQRVPGTAWAPCSTPGGWELLDQGRRGPGGAACLELARLGWVSQSPAHSCCTAYRRCEHQEGEWGAASGGAVHWASRRTAPPGAWIRWGRHPHLALCHGWVCQGLKGKPTRGSSSAAIHRALATGSRAWHCPAGRTHPERGTAALSRVHGEHSYR